MANITWQYEPLVVKPKHRERRRAQFSAAWTKTMDLLEREIFNLGAHAAVIQVDADRSDFRLDGFLRVTAKSLSPAVAISFESVHGNLTYPCDTYLDWRDNVRAIALALEALRTVDRYGVTSRGEQYTGWAALPPPDSNGFVDQTTALAFIRKITGRDVGDVPFESLLREAEMITHPDRGGSPETFKRVQAARTMLIGGNA